LTFTISSGGNSGTSDVVVWNDALTHKTEFGPTKDTKKGYPDPSYLDDVMAQLLQFGLMDEEIVWKRNKQNIYTGYLLYIKTLKSHFCFYEEENCVSKWQGGKSSSQSSKV